MLNVREQIDISGISFEEYWSGLSDYRVISNPFVPNELHMINLETGESVEFDQKIFIENYLARLRGM